MQLRLASCVQWMSPIAGQSRVEQTGLVSSLKFSAKICQAFKLGPAIPGKHVPL